MIRLIAAVDKKYGITDKHGIPWQGKLKPDVRYYHQKIKGETTIMGYGMYTELSKPLVNESNFVASRRGTKLRNGFILVEDAIDFLRNEKGNVWVLGGSALFASTLSVADELYLTRLDSDFCCTKFFPQFEQAFYLADQSEEQVSNGITFQFQVWRRHKQ